MIHARPHLETHNREKGQNAVAGAAYRLGLRLYDRRLRRSFDFRERADGEEIVFQTTLAPTGAPAWASDPLELWNRVESAERRKDAQLARDYRVPLPLGLPDADVAAMALEIAQYIAKKLTTPVSVGVHRDSKFDAFGALKPTSKIGCHAHLYFPTRKILLDQAATDDDRKGGSGMGAKLDFLARSSTSKHFVDDLNNYWADTANRYAAKHGIPADFDHRSYRRMGLRMPTQPKLGAAATAMERKGVATQRGDRVREAKVMAKVYRSVHAKRIAQMTRHAQAGGSMRSTATPAPATSPSFDLRIARASDIHFTRPVTDPRTLPLVDRFKALYLAGMEEGDRPEQTLIYRLVLAIDRALRRLRRAGETLLEQDRERRQAVTAKLDAQADLSEWRQGRAAEVEAAAEAAARMTPWARAVKEMATWMNAAEPIEVTRSATDEAQVREESLASRAATMAGRLADIDEQMKPTKRVFVEQRSALKCGLRDLAEANEQALPQLLAVSIEEERKWIERYMPELLRPVQDLDQDEGGTGGLTSPRLTPRRAKGAR